MQTDWRGFTAKVSDFGLSKLLAEIAPVSVANLTEDNQKRDCSGTVTHMAPELLSEGANSSAADVYAFGIMSEYLFKALSKCSLLRTHCQSCWAWLQPVGCRLSDLGIIQACSALLTSALQGCTA